MSHVFDRNIRKTVRKRKKAITKFRKVEARAKAKKKPQTRRKPQLGPRRPTRKEKFKQNIKTFGKKLGQAALDAATVIPAVGIAGKAIKGAKKGKAILQEAKLAKELGSKRGKDLITSVNKKGQPVRVDAKGRTLTDVTDKTPQEFRVERAKLIKFPTAGLPGLKAYVDQTRRKIATGFFAFKNKTKVFKVESGGLVDKTRPFLYNTKIGKAIKTTLAAIVVTGGAVAIWNAWVGSKAFAKFEVVESIDKLSFPRSVALDLYDQTGDPEMLALAQELTDISNDITSEEAMDALDKLLPGLNVKAAAEDGIKSGRIANAAYNQIFAWKRNNPGRTFNEQRIATEKLVRRERAEADRQFNNDRIATEKEIIRLRAEAKTERDKEERKILLETIAEWEAYAGRQRSFQAQERENSAAFWLAYRRALAELEEEQGRSNLNFGGDLF